MEAAPFRIEQNPHSMVEVRRSKVQSGDVTGPWPNPRASGKMWMKKQRAYSKFK